MPIFASCHLDGRLGNQLFQISNVLSFCKNNNLIPVFPQINTFQHSIKYKDNIFRKIK